MLGVARTLNMKQVLAVLYLAILTFSATAGERAEVPSVMNLFLGGSIYGPTYSVELRDGVLHYTERNQGKETSAIVTPTPEQWIAFRKALDVNDVWTWRRTKSAQMHSQQWTVRITYRAAKIDRSGDGKSPGRSPTGFGGTVEFDNFKKAVSALLGGKKFE
jgi:hypothetical protein